MCGLLMLEDHFPAVVMNVRPRPVCPWYVVCIMKISQTTDGCCRLLDMQQCGPVWRVACGEANVNCTLCMLRLSVQRNVRWPRV